MSNLITAEASANSKGRPEHGMEPPSGFTAIVIKGFKSLAGPTRVEFRPLTVLAGSNSSGKSSAIQPLLLLKQTLEAPFNPGPILLEGAHVRFSEVSQLLSRVSGEEVGRTLSVEISLAAKEGNDTLSLVFQETSGGGLELVKTRGFLEGVAYEIDRTLDGVFSRVHVAGSLHRTFKAYAKEPQWTGGRPVWKATLDRFLPELRLEVGEDHVELHTSRPGQILSDQLLGLIHVPGLRGNPQRTYQTTSVSGRFSGTFEPYIASLIHFWKVTKNQKLHDAGHSLRRLGLGWQVTANQLDATRLELLVSRLSGPSESSGSDLVSIADVGFGVSQVLPVVVALLQARPGQLVYIEQPELHLHPRAQTAMAGLLTEAANRGVRVVAETHSSLLLLSLQTLVAQGKIKPEDVILHWFERDQEGRTKVTSADLDAEGTYGDWPEDFGEVSLDSHEDFLEAVETRLLAK